MLQLDLCSPAAYAAVAVVLALGCAIRWAALPKPLPGIPYNKSSATSILGDALAMVKHKWKSGTIFDWMASQGVELNSPVCQLFLKPLSKPAVIVIDPRETQDVLLRRAKDFDRSQFFQGTELNKTPSSLSTSRESQYQRFQFPTAGESSGFTYGN